MSNPSSVKAMIKPVVPKLFEIVEDVVYGDIWERKELSKRDRSMITVAALIAMHQSDRLQSHLEKAYANGVTPLEVSEMITHLAFYAGFPSAVAAALVVRTMNEVNPPA